MSRLMWERLLCGLLLGAADCAGMTARAQAQPDSTTIGFTITGFADAATGVYDPNKSYSGSFTGADANGDGLIELNELTAFTWAGVDYKQRFGYEGYCGDGSNNFFCGLYTFTYKPGLQPDFSTYWESWDGHLAEEGSTVAGNRIVLTVKNGPGSQTELWTSDTQFSLSPVPEPRQATMLLTALALGGLMAARRRRWGK